MSTDYNEKYVFEAEWYDEIACIMKKFYLLNSSFMSNWVVRIKI